MKKLILFFALLSATLFSKAQCLTSCAPIIMMNLSDKIIDYTALYYTCKCTTYINPPNTAVFYWVDEFNSKYCNNWSNPNIKGYHVRITENGVLFRDTVVKAHGYASGNDTWYYYIPVVSGKTYKATVCTVCSSGGEMCSGLESTLVAGTPTSPPIAPATPSTVPTTKKNGK